MRHAPEKHTAAEAVAIERANLEELIKNHEAAERKQRQLALLEEERRTVEEKLAHALSIGPEGKHRLEIAISNPSGSGHYFIDRTGAQLRVEAEGQLQAIDIELARVEREGMPDPQQEAKLAHDVDMARFPAIQVR
ncbi:MAG: hypothetical protein ACXVFE_03570 [Gaiellaceae bacterium]